MVTPICILICMRKKGFRCFFLVADPALVTVPYTAIAATEGPSSQKRPAPIINMLEATKNFIFMLRTLSWLLDNSHMRYKPLTTLNGHSLFLTVLSQRQNSLQLKAGPSHLQYIPPTLSLLQMHLRANLPFGNNDLQNVFLREGSALQQNMKFWFRGRVYKVTL